MAIATLEKCYNNPDVFRYEVKIRKGTAVQMIMSANDYRTVCRYFQEYAQRFLKKIPKDDPNAERYTKHFSFSFLCLFFADSL
jgi:farnesyl-diphosphate farnesyltransferase